MGRVLVAVEFSNEPFPLDLFHQAHVEERAGHNERGIRVRAEVADVARTFMPGGLTAYGPFSSAYVDAEMAELIHRGHVSRVNQDRGTDFFHDCRSLQPLSGAEPAAQEDGTQNRPLSAIECDLPQTLFSFVILLE